MVYTNRVSDRKSCQPSSTTNVSGQSQMYSPLRSFEVRLFALHTAIEEYFALKWLTVDDFVLQVSISSGLVWTLDLLKYKFLHLLSFWCLVKSFKQNRFFSLIHEIVLCFLRFILITWTFHAWSLLHCSHGRPSLNVFFLIRAQRWSNTTLCIKLSRKKVLLVRRLDSLLVTLFMSFCEWALRSRSSFPVGGFVEVEVARKAR